MPAGYALVADRSHSPRPAPLAHALFVDVSVPAGAAPPHFALTVHEQAGGAEALPRRAPYRAITAAFFLHLAVIALFIARPDQPKRLGMEDGTPEALNVSVISAEDLRRLSSDPFKQDGTPSPVQDQSQPAPPPQLESQPVPPPQEPVQQEANAAPPEPQPKPSERSDTGFDASSFIEMASQQFSAQLDHAFKAAEARREQPKREEPKRSASLSAGNVKMMRPGATHIGKSDEWARAVIWALSATKPMGNGKWGTTVVTFEVSAAGHVEGLRMIKSSDDHWLDTAALMAVRQARMPTPPAGLPSGDRTFIIEYISLPGPMR